MEPPWYHCYQGCFKKLDTLLNRDYTLLKLELNIMTNPDKYPVMQGTGGLRKARFAFEHQGKSGGVRVCYVDFVVKEIVYLITVYPKSEKDNLTQAERNAIKKMLTKLEENL